MEMRYDTPMVSVIVPIYKVEAYLRECIHSVLNQTYANYELILVNDGSPDRCGEICEEYVRKDCRIRVIHKENGGLSSARNAGLDIATGKYVYFLDSDDLIEPELLERAVAHMEAGVDLVVFNFCRFYENGKKEKCCFHETGVYLMPDEISHVDFVMKTVLRGKIGWEACFRVFVREKIEQYGLRFEDNRKIFAEDLYFFLCYCAHAERILSMEDCLYYYRIREDSIMGVEKRKNNVGRINELSKAVLAHYQKFEDCKMLVDNFDIIRMQIILKQFASELWTTVLTPEEFRKAVWDCIPDRKLLESQARLLLKQKDLARLVGSYADALDLKAHARFLLDGSWNKLRLCSKLVRMLRQRPNGR